MRTLSRSVLPFLAFALLLAGPAVADAPAGDQTVPDVVGLQVRDAEVLLEQAGFPFEIETVKQTGVPMGTVLSQDPGGLAVRTVGTTVRVHVAGPTIVVVADPDPEPPVAPPAEPPPGEAPPSGNLPEPPSLEPAAPPSGEPPAEAPALPPEAPLAPVLPGLEGLPAEPGPDTNGPALPSAFRLSRQEAEQKLAGYQLLLEVTLAAPDMQGRVVEQYPVPGTTLALGQTVTLIFGLANEPGREYRQVPALKGLTPERAQEKLSEAGYGVAWCTIPSPNDLAGLVVDTTPHRFSYLLKGEAVRVRIGRGTGEAPPPPVTEVTPAPPTPPSTEEPPSGELPAPTEPVAPVEPPPPPPFEPIPVPSDPPAGPVEPPSEPPPSEPLPSEPPPSEPPAPPSEPPPSEPPPVEPAPVEPVPTEPAPTPFLPQPPRPAPGPVTLTGPADSDSFPRAYGPTFEWRTVPNADGYEWELEQETNGSWQPVRSERLLGTKFRPARMEIGRYRWRARALNGDVPGSWADYRLLFLY